MWTTTRNTPPLGKNCWPPVSQPDPVPVRLKRTGIPTERSIVFTGISRRTTHRYLTCKGNGYSDLLLCYRCNFRAITKSEPPTGNKIPARISQRSRLRMFSRQPFNRRPILNSDISSATFLLFANRAPSIKGNNRDTNDVTLTTHKPTVCTF